MLIHVLTWKNLENMPREKCQTQAQARHKRPQSVRFPLHKMSRIGKSIKTESITESSFQGLWQKKMVYSCQEVWSFFWDDENVLELDNDDYWITL